LFKLNVKNFYISAFNKKKYYNLNHNINVIGSAHNIKEILEKKNQGCKKIILSRLFQTYKKGYLNIVRFNLISLNCKNIVALGGINEDNFKKLKMVNCVGFAMQSELNRKPQYLMR
jgi:thiamine-phosphate pyrophosphorylase